MNQADFNFDAPEFIDTEDCMGNVHTYWRVWARHFNLGTYVCGTGRTQHEAIENCKLNIVDHPFQYTFHQFWKDQSEWSEATFSKEKGCIGALKHLAKEVQETLEDPSDLEEYADMMHLIFDACRRAGFSYGQLLEACYNKLQKNKKRKWGPVVADQPCEHIAEG